MTNEELEKAFDEYKTTFEHTHTIVDFSPEIIDDDPENCWPANLYIDADIRRENVAGLIKLLQEFEQSSAVQNENAEPAP